MSIIKSNSGDLQSAKEDLLLETFEKNKIFSTVHKDRLGKDLKEGDMVFCIRYSYGYYDIMIGMITGFTALRVRVLTYKRAPAPYKSTESFAPEDVIRVEMSSIRDMFGIKN